MSWIMLKQPHPLDRIWEQALESLSDAQHEMEALGADFTDDQLNEAGDRLTEVVLTLMALPARNSSDSLIKLDLAIGHNGDGRRDDCNVEAIMNEATAVLNAGVARGTELKRAIPDLLEGVAL